MADPYFTPNRSEMIEEILSDLKSGKYDEHKVAVDHLIDFFEAAKSPLRYILWLLIKAPFLKQYELLELTDLGNQRWNELFYPRMIVAERLKFPGLVEPLVKKLCTKLTKGEIEYVLQLGSGPMEIERQVIERLKTAEKPVRFVGIDISPHAHTEARINLELAGICTTQLIDKAELIKILHERPTSTEVFLYVGDGIELLKELTFTNKHLLFHSLFKHHLSASQKEELSSIIRDKRIFTIEYDGIRDWLSMLLASFGTWDNPVFLNSAVFSNRRYALKKDLQKMRAGTEFYYPATSYSVSLNVSETQ